MAEDIEKLTQQRDDVQRQLSQMTTQKAKASDQLTSWKKKLESVERSLVAQQNSHTSMKVETSSTIQNLEAELERCRGNIERLQGMEAELSSCRRALETTTAKIQALETELATKQKVEEHARQTVALNQRQGGQIEQLEEELTAETAKIQALATRTRWEETGGREGQTNRGFESDASGADRVTGGGADGSNAKIRSSTRFGRSDISGGT